MNLPDNVTGYICVTLPDSIFTILGYCSYLGYSVWLYQAVHLLFLDIVPFLERVAHLCRHPTHIYIQTCVLLNVVWITECVAECQTDHRTDCWIQQINLTVNYMGYTAVRSCQTGIIIALLYELLRVSELTVIILLIVK